MSKPTKPFDFKLRPASEVMLCASKVARADFCCFVRSMTDSV